MTKNSKMEFCNWEKNHPLNKNCIEYYQQHKLGYKMTYYYYLASCQKMRLGNGIRYSTETDERILLLPAAHLLTIKKDPTFI